MGNEGKIFGWHPPMKLPEFTEKQNLAGFWMNLCSCFDPLTCSALHKAGPAPWMFWANNNQIWFANTNWGVGDEFQSTVGGGSVKEPPKDEAELKLEKEKKEAEEAKRKKEKEDKEYAQKRLNEKFHKLKPLLVSYKESLDKLYDAETDETKKRELWDASRAIANCTSKATDANYEKMLEIYNANENTIKDAKAKEITKGVTTDNNPAYNDLVTNLKDGIDKADETFGILKKSSSGAYKWGEISGDDEDQPIDIMELISAWNSTYVGDGNHAYLIKYIAEKRNTFTSAKKEQYKTLSDNLHKQLLDAGTEINQKRLSATTKKALKDALDDFKKFDSIDKRFSAAQEPIGENYSNAFENLYIAIRLAEAEIADKDLEDAFNFLGDENPYKGKAATVETVKADLERECRETKTVTEPVVPEPPKEQVIKIAGEEYKVITSGDDVKYIRTRDNKEFTKETLKTEIKVSDVTVNEDGSYSYKYDNKTLSFDKDHTAQVTDGQNNNSGTTDKTIKIRGVEYKVTGSGDDVKYTRTSDNKVFNKIEFTSEVGISDLVINPDGSYVFKFNNTTYKFDKDHNPIEEP